MLRAWAAAGEPPYGIGAVANAALNELVPAGRAERLARASQALAERERGAAVRGALAALDVWGVLCALGVRLTVMSVPALPPPRTTLEAAFCEPHDRRQPARLCVGARAAAKHCQRGAARWWGELGGSDSQKNAHAVALMARVLDDVTWMNTHRLTAGSRALCFEVRCSAGYGMRWSADGRVFIGFLEPHAAGSHETGWRHG